MIFEDHCRECLEKLGNPFKEVHQWLDAFAGSKEHGMKHRRKRHHLKGIHQVELLFGREAAEAARLHVISDLKEEGWSEQDGIPKDEADYIRRGYF